MAATAYEKEAAGSSDDGSLKKSKIKRNKSSVVKIQESDTDEFSHLDSREAEVLRAQVALRPNKVSFFTIFRYADSKDKLFIFGYLLFSIGAGAALPLMTVVFGQLTLTFSNFFLGTVSSDAFMSEVSTYTVYFVYIGIAMFCLTYASTVMSMYTGANVTRKIREHYLESNLSQNIAYFDKLGAGEVTTRITSDANLIQNGISHQISLAVTSAASFISAYVIGFTQSWKLTLILTSVIVAMLLIFTSFSTFIVKWTNKTLSSYAEGGTVAEEVISTIRIAQAFGTQERLALQYEEHLTVAEKWGTLKSSALGVTVALMFFVIFAAYALAFWQGANFLVAGDLQINQLVTCLLAVQIGAFALGSVAPCIQSIMTAVSASSKLFETIDRPSYLASALEGGGEVIDSVKGEVVFQNVKFIYPSRPEVTVLKDFSLKVPAGKRTALVGASGCGKSTVIGIVERFYDPVGGTVSLDGVDIKNLNLKWLRRQISLVSQEPVLFATTIYKNVEFGLLGTEYEDASPEKKFTMIEEACKMANAHEFIVKLPNNYETNVGERGFLLSGGQKQRIAIARAIVSDPRILLLDEATSALDVRSEGVVQDALDKASKSRTTIVIAHRLSTIRDAENIVVMSEGQIVEQGTHNELLSSNGTYFDLCEAQRIQASVESVVVGESKSEEYSQDSDSILELSKTVSMHDALERISTGFSQASGVGKLAASNANYSIGSLVKFTAAFNRNERSLVVIGILSAIVCGSANPIAAIFFSKCIAAISLPLSMADQIVSEADFWSLMYFVLALTVLSAYSINGIAFAISRERLIKRVRDAMFRKIMRQDIAFFDEEKNSVGALTSSLSTEANDLAGMSGITLGTILSTSTTIVFAVILSLAYGWKLALVCSSTIPLLIGCGYFRFKILERFEARTKEEYEACANYACEATSAIRTVASLTREDQVLNEYSDNLDIQAKRSLRSTLKSSILYACSQSLVFFIVGLTFWYGGTLIASFEYNIQQFFVCFIAIIFGAQSAGTVFNFSPDMGKAKKAAVSIKTLMDTEPIIGRSEYVGDKLEDCKGLLELKNIHFSYPTRSRIPVLKSLNLVVQPGQYAALVGPSGCGKSTVVSLIERFYDPIDGLISIDGHDITKLNLNSYREQLAIVSQEPTLYQGSIRYNILLGTQRTDVTEEELTAACKDANIHDFIISLPQGYDTLCGQKGSQLSGGQKQRIAIARALIRNPKVLLLDEATSALDSESEKVVQAALDAAAKGRTTVAIAHRLSTIQNADVIYVFDQGKIVESGDHALLMSLKGKYFELVQLQDLEKK